MGEDVGELGFAVEFGFPVDASVGAVVALGAVGVGTAV